VARMEIREISETFWFESLKGSYHSEDRGVGVKLILKSRSY
jgi:hypothetical protein